MSMPGSADFVHETPPPALVLVKHRIYERPVEAVLTGNVLYSDQIYYRHDGPRRYFWLIDEDVQLVYEPFGWRAEWYVDLVSISRGEVAGTPCFTVSDAYVDIVVEGMGPTYRILDLDEAGDAAANGDIAAAQLASTLTRTQQFLDRHLHRGGTFPPLQIVPLFSPDHHYPSWSTTPVRFRANESG